MKFSAAVAFLGIASVNAVSRKTLLEKKRKLLKQEEARRLMKEETIEEMRHEGFKGQFAVFETVTWKPDELPETTLPVQIIPHSSIKVVEGDSRTLRGGNGGKSSGGGDSGTTKFFIFEQDDDDHVLTLLNGSFKTVINDDDETPICNAYIQSSINIAADSEDLHAEYAPGEATSCAGQLRADAFGEFNEDTGCDELYFAYAGDSSADIEMGCMEAFSIPTFTILDCQIVYPDDGNTATCADIDVDNTDFPPVSLDMPNTNTITVWKLECCPIPSVAALVGGSNGGSNGKSGKNGHRHRRK